MFIDGLGVSGYRSFGPDLQHIGPLKKINLFIGQNNSGKSNTLLFLTHHYQQAASAAQNGAGKISFEIIDRHVGQNGGQLTVTFGLKTGGSLYQELLKKYEKNLEKSHIQLIERILASKALSGGSKVAWFSYESQWAQKIARLTLQNDIVKNLKTEMPINDTDWHSLWRQLSSQNGGDINQHWIPETINALSPVNHYSALPKAYLIPAIRRVGEGNPEDSDYSGLGLIERLAKLQNPNYDEQPKKKHFEEINEFLRTVMVNPTATLEIPHDRKNILVHMDGRTLPLGSLGTGIHEVIILAAAATVLRDQIVCIEEPELHLHPLLQKKLIRYLNNKTTNQYFITTHSAHLLDTPEAAIFHIRHQGGQSTVEPVYSAVSKASICADLGYRASDILQANCVIWVEGPSDRMYLSHWIRAYDSELIEGIHYSIMFYGGRLLSHLSAHDPEVDDFISLRRLNRYIAIIIDSDMSGLRKHINETKRRIRDEFNEGPGFAWVTKGREIENYLPTAIVERAVKKVHPQATALVATGHYEHCLHYRNEKGKVIDMVDKVKIAHEAIKEPADLNILDLKPMIAKMVAFIRASNDF